ncbi:MAG: acetylglutamate kinase [Planctomycetota bacterium]|nr:MAG: acetylglutamate kinase [Planctomycetota bacterium]
MKDIVLLKQALPYMREHKGCTFVIKLGGELAARPETLASLAADLSLLVHVGIRVTLVHGGGPQATEMSRRLGLEPRLVDGRRVTDEATLDVAKMVFAGSINVDILSALRAQGVRAVGLSGVDGDILHVRRRDPVAARDEGGQPITVDYGLVGDVEGVDASLLSLLMGEGYVPVVSSLGGDADGNILNVNADTVASVLATELGASKLLLLTGAPGLLSDPSDPASLVPALSVSEARAKLDDPSVQGGMRPKLAALVSAVEGGVERGHILSGSEPSALLLELFTREGCGTLVRAEHADAVARSPRARAGESARAVLRAVESQGVESQRVEPPHAAEGAS